MHMHRPAAVKRPQSHTFGSVFGDTDEDVNKKVLKVLGEGIKCILCIGELKEERESGETFNVCDTQLTGGLKGVTAAP